MPQGVQGRDVVFQDSPGTASTLGSKHIKVVFAAISFAILLMKACKRRREAVSISPELYLQPGKLCRVSSVGRTILPPTTTQDPCSAALPVPCAHMLTLLSRRRGLLLASFPQKQLQPLESASSVVPLSPPRQSPNSSSALHPCQWFREETAIPSGPKKAPHWAQKKCSGCHVLSKAVTTFCSEEDKVQVT